MMKNIILYNTKTKRNKLIDEDRFPYSVLAVASVLKNVRIIDGTVEDFDLNEIEKCDIVGISMIGGYKIKEALGLSKKIKEIKDVPIVWGGWFPSMFPELVLKKKDIDYVVRGQGELTFKELIEGKPLHEIKGLGYKKDNKIIINPERELTDLNEFPRYPFHLLKMDKYKNNYMLGSKVATYIASRGCPYNCAFCNDKIIYKRRVLNYSVERVMEDLKLLIEKYKFDGIMFQDETFFMNKERVLKICNEIIKNKWDIKWSCYARVDELNRFSEEEFNILKKSNCCMFIVGVESGNQETLNMIEKGIKLEDAFKFAKVAKKYKFDVVFEFIAGFPEESDKSVEDTFKAIMKLKKINQDFDINLFFYNPMPKTKLYDLAVEKGILKVPKSIEEHIEFGHYSGVMQSEKLKEKVRKFIFYFTLAYPSKSKRLVINKSGIKIIYRTIEKIIKMRFFFNIFYFPIEWGLYKTYKNMFKKDWGSLWETE